MERQNFNYPPFSRLIKISCKHKDALELHKAVQAIKSNLSQAFGDRILGPEKPYVGKIRNWYIMNFLLKIENESSAINRDKKLLQAHIDHLQQQEEYKNIRWTIDVDPV